MAITSKQAAELIVKTTQQACLELNQFTHEVMRTRGGRIGSGMGGVIEALWGFYLNRALKDNGVSEIEIAWICGHEYNDFACVVPGQEWIPETGEGELLRVEVKSMLASADESKAHFDRLIGELQENELLAVFLWDWTPVEQGTANVYPNVVDYFIGDAHGVALLRDELHLYRGGSFVQPGSCPDVCEGGVCRHVGEPLNASGTRERKTGPQVSQRVKTSHAANFGGLLRMLGVKGANGRAILAKHSADRNSSASQFLSFMARHFLKVATNLERGAK